MPTAEKKNYDNGDLLRKGSYKNGLKNGVFEEFYPNGAVKTSVTYRNGVQHGPARMYTKDNHLTNYTEYADGVREGVAYSYYNNETPHIFAYRKNDKLDGTAKVFNTRGELVELITYQDGAEIRRTKFTDK